MPRSPRATITASDAWSIGSSSTSATSFSILERSRTSSTPAPKLLTLSADRTTIKPDSRPRSPAPSDIVDVLLGKGRSADTHARQVDPFPAGQISARDASHSTWRPHADTRSSTRPSFRRTRSPTEDPPPARRRSPAAPHPGHRPGQNDTVARLIVTGRGGQGVFSDPADRRGAPPRVRWPPRNRAPAGSGPHLSGVVWDMLRRATSIPASQSPERVPSREAGPIVHTILVLGGPAALHR